MYINPYFSVKIKMQQFQPQSPFLKHVPQNEHTFLAKIMNKLIQTDKQNISNLNPQILINKMSIGQDQLEGYLVEVAQMVRIKKETARELFKGLQKENSIKRLIFGVLCHKKLSSQKAKSTLGQKIANTQTNSYLNLNILLKLRSEEYPYVSMFACDCLISILKLHLNRIQQFREEDIRIKWKYDILFKGQKIGQIMVLNDLKGDFVFSNVGIRLKLGSLIKEEGLLCRDLLQQFGSRLNISKNLRETASKIHRTYEESLLDLGQQVIIKRKQPNQWQETIIGRFIRVNQVGHAILENEEGIEQQVEEGYMERRSNSDCFNQAQKIEQQMAQDIQIADL